MISYSFDWQFGLWVSVKISYQLLKVPNHEMKSVLLLLFIEPNKIGY